MSKNTTRPAALNTKTEDGLPVWPAARVIDGYAYALESTHPTIEAAVARVEQVREAGDAAQAFESGRPKFASAGTVKGQAAYFAHAAAVYTVPAGKLGRVEGETVVWADRPPRVVAEKPAKAAKKGKKAAEETGDLKTRIKARVAAESAEKAQAKAA